MSRKNHKPTQPSTSFRHRGGGTLFFSHIHRLGPLLGGSKLLIIGDFQKNDNFWGDEIVDIFLGHHKTGLFLVCVGEVISLRLGLFLKNGIYFLDC